MFNGLIDKNAVYASSRPIKKIDHYGPCDFKYQGGQNSESSKTHKLSKVNHKSSEVNHKSSEINHKSSKINYKSSEVNHKSSKINHKSSEVNHKSSEVNHKSSKTKTSKRVTSSKNVKSGKNYVKSSRKNYKTNNQKRSRSSKFERIIAKFRDIKLAVKKMFHTKEPPKELHSLESPQEAVSTPFMETNLESTLKTDLQPQKSISTKPHEHREEITDPVPKLEPQQPIEEDWVWVPSRNNPYEKETFASIRKKKERLSELRFLAETNRPLPIPEKKIDPYAEFEEYSRWIINYQHYMHEKYEPGTVNPYTEILADIKEEDKIRREEKLAKKFKSVDTIEDERAVLMEIVRKYDEEQDERIKRSLMHRGPKSQKDLDAEQRHRDALRKARELNPYNESAWALAKRRMAERKQRELEKELELKKNPRPPNAPRDFLIKKIQVQEHVSPLVPYGFKEHAHIVETKPFDEIQELAHTKSYPYKVTAIYFKVPLNTENLPSQPLQVGSSSKNSKSQKPLKTKVVSKEESHDIQPKYNVGAQVDEDENGLDPNFSNPYYVKNKAEDSRIKGEVSSSHWNRKITKGNEKSQKNKSYSIKDISSPNGDSVIPKKNKSVLSKPVCDKRPISKSTTVRERNSFQFRPPPPLPTRSNIGPKTVSEPAVEDDERKTADIIKRVRLSRSAPFGNYHAKYNGFKYAPGKDEFAEVSDIGAPAEVKVCSKGKTVRFSSKAVKDEGESGKDVEDGFGSRLEKPGETDNIQKVFEGDNCHLLPTDSIFSAGYHDATSGDASKNSYLQGSSSGLSSNWNDGLLKTHPKNLESIVPQMNSIQTVKNESKQTTDRDMPPSNGSQPNEDSKAKTSKSQKETIIKVQGENQDVVTTLSNSESWSNFKNINTRLNEFVGGFLLTTGWQSGKPSCTNNN